MIAVTQVVDQANVSISGQEENQNSVGKGMIVFLGVSKSDTEQDVEKMVNKLLKLRIFPDDSQKMNLDIRSINGEVLLISQFTLLGSLKGNNRLIFLVQPAKNRQLRFTNRLLIN